MKIKLFRNYKLRQYPLDQAFVWEQISDTQQVNGEDYTFRCWARKYNDGTYYCPFLDFLTVTPSSLDIKTIESVEVAFIDNEQKMSTQWRPEGKEWVRKRNQYFENNQSTKTRQNDYEAGANAMFVAFWNELYGKNDFICSNIKDTVPVPGSVEAIKQGCRCCVLDEVYVRINETCPLHGIGNPQKEEGKMIKAKMCIVCNRLVKWETVECPCGGKEFKEVILDNKGE